MGRITTESFWIGWLAYTSQKTTAGIMVKESRSAISHVSKVWSINGRGVHKFIMIMGPLEMNKAYMEWHRGRGVVWGLSYQIIAFSGTCHGLITMHNNDIELLFGRDFWSYLWKFIISWLRLLNHCCSLILKMPHVFSALGDDDTNLWLWFFWKQSDADCRDRVMLAAEIVSGCGNWF